MKEIKLKVEGMSCTGCEKRIENALKTCEEVKNVSANHQTNTVTIKLEENQNIDFIIEKIEDIGFTVKEK